MSRRDTPPRARKRQPPEVARRYAGRVAASWAFRVQKKKHTMSGTPALLPDMVRVLALSSDTDILDGGLLEPLVSTFMINPNGILQTPFCSLSGHFHNSVISTAAPPSTITHQHKTPRSPPPLAPLLLPTMDALGLPMAFGKASKNSTQPANNSSSSSSAPAEASSSADPSSSSSRGQARTRGPRGAVGSGRRGRSTRGGHGRSDGARAPGQDEPTEQQVIANAYAARGSGLTQGQGVNEADKEGGATAAAEAESASSTHGFTTGDKVCVFLYFSNELWRASCLLHSPITTGSRRYPTRRRVCLCLHSCGGGG